MPRARGGSSWLLVTILTLQALSSWYQAVMIFVADAVLLVWLTIVEPALDGRWTLWTCAASHPADGAGGRGRGRRARRRVAVCEALSCPRQRRTRGGRCGVSGSDRVPHAAGKHRAWAMADPLAASTGPRWIWGELTVYLGWTTLLLAASGAAAAIIGRTEWLRRCRFFILLGLVAAALALGPSAGRSRTTSGTGAPLGSWRGFPASSCFARRRDSPRC